MQKIIQLINLNIVRKPNITLIKYNCECREHSDHTMHIRKCNKILKCEKCGSLMRPECIKYNRSTCLICVKKRGINTSRNFMCTLCGNIDKFGNTFCWECKKKNIDCFHFSWVLCARCKYLSFSPKFFNSYF